MSMVQAPRLLWCMLTLLMAACQMLRSHRRPIDLEAVCAYTRNKDTRALLQAASGHPVDRTVAFAIAYGLYLIEPKEYATFYVASVPVDTRTIGDIYQRYDLNPNCRREFLGWIDSLGLLARQGDLAAIRRLVYGTVRSDGVIGEEFCDELRGCLDQQMGRTLRVLAQVDKDTRREVRDLLCALYPDEMKALRLGLEEQMRREPSVLTVARELSSCAE